MNDEDRKTIDEFGACVNLSPAKLENWLKTEASRSVGFSKSKNAEAVGHASGRRIVGLLRKHQADYTDEDIAHMRKTVGYVHRHLAQRPVGDVTATPWRHSLMNWGHDPSRQ